MAAPPPATFRNAGRESRRPVPLGGQGMTVALVLAENLDEVGAGQQKKLCGQLAALGVHRVDAAERTGPALLTVAAAARAAGERVLICVGADTVPEPVLARLLGAGGTAAFTGVTAGTVPATPATRPAPGSTAGGALAGGALVVDAPDLDALARAAETLAATHARPALVGALIGELTRRGVTVRILDAGPDSQGAVAQLIADPAARDMARWAAWRKLTPAALYGISLGLGLVAALWFAELAVRAKLLAIAALAGSFLFARTGSLLAATSRDGRVRPLVSWLGTACGLLTEVAIYAALAVSSGLVPNTGPAGPPAGVVGLDGTFGGALRHTFVATWGGTGTVGVWRLAIAALLVLGVRRMAELGYEHTARVPGNLFPRSALRILEQAVTFPAGERYAVIVVTAVFFGPRLTFLILLGWGVLAAGYVLAGQAARSAERARRAGPAAGPGVGGLAAYRGDGIVSRWVGGLVQGRLPPLPPVLAGLLVTGVLAALGLGNLPGILLLTPIEAMMLAALGALGLSRHVAAWLVFALLAAVVVRHVDLAFRARAGRGLPADVFGLGWEGRMLLAGVAAAAGLAPFAYALLSGYLWVLFIWDFLSGWLVPTELVPTELAPTDLAPTGPGPTDGDDG